MTILTIALKYLRGRLVASTLTAVSIALGVSLVIASVLLARGIKEGFISGALAVAGGGVGGALTKSIGNQFLKTALESGITDLRSALEGEDADAIRQKSHALTESSYKLAEAVYANAQAQASSQGSDGRCA